MGKKIMITMFNTEAVCCTVCGTELTDTMEVEYSETINEYFCDPKCASDRYYDYMRSRPIDYSILRPGVVLLGGMIRQLDK